MPPAGRGRGRGQAKNTGKSPGRGRSPRTRTRKSVKEVAEEAAEEGEPEPVALEAEEDVEQREGQHTEEQVPEEHAGDGQEDASTGDVDGTEDPAGAEAADDTLPHEEEELMDNDQMEGDEEVIDEYIAEGEGEQEGEEHAEEGAEEGDQEDAVESEQVEAEEGDQMEAEEGEQVEAEEGDVIDDDQENAEYNGEAEEGMDGEEEQHDDGDNTQDGAADGQDGEDEAEGDAEHDEAVDEEEKSADQSEDYCVVDEVSGDTEEQDKNDGAKQAPTKNSSKRSRTKKAPATKEGDESKDSKTAEKLGPRSRPTRGFMATRYLLSKEVQKADACHVLMSPITVDDFLKEDTQAAVKAAKCVVFKLGRKGMDPGKGFLGLKYDTEKEAEDVLNVLKENFKDAEILETGNNVKIQEKVRDLHTKFIASALMDFGHENTLALYNIPKELDKSKLVEAFGESVKINIPQNVDKSNKCFGFVEFSSPEQVKEWVSKDTLTIKDNIIKLMPIVETPTTKNLMSKLHQLQLNEWLTAPLSSALKQHYQHLAEMILYFLNWAKPSELHSVNKKALQAFHSQLNNKLKISAMLERKAEKAKASQSKGQGSKETKGQAANKVEGPNKGPGAHRQKDKPQGQGRNRNRGNRQQGSRDKSAARFVDHRTAAAAGNKRSQQHGRYDDKAKRPRRDSGGHGGFYNDMSRDGRRRSAGSMGMGAGMVPSGSTLNAMTGLPNMNRMQTMGAMPAMGMQQPLMGMPQQMGSMAMGGFQGRQQQHGGRDDMGYGAQRDFLQNPAFTMDQNKADTAINLLLGLSKMLNDRSQSSGDASHGYNNSQGGSRF